MRTLLPSRLLSAVRAGRGLRGRIFYGWFIVAGLAAVSAVVAGMGGINAGLFIKPMSADLGIGQAFFGWATTARLLGYAATGWLIGRILDRRGARLPLALAGLMMGLALVGLSAATAGWQIIVLFFLTGATGLQGAGANLYSTVPVARWFIRRRGRALSLTFLGTPAGIFVFPPLTQLLIDGLGWRATWLILGVSGAAVIVLVSLLVIRHQPQDMGLQPDGDADVEPQTSAAAHGPARRRAAEYSWTRAQAMRSTTFWRLAAVDGLRMVAMSTLGLFRIPYFIDQGVDAQIVALALSAEAVAAVVVAIPAGWASDRFQPRYVSVLATGGMLLAFGLTIAASSAWMVFVATMMLGLGISSFQVSQGAIWPDYFGSANIGRIRGLSLPIGLAFSALGAPATGIIKDHTGTYVPAWIAGMVGLAIATLILLVTPKPARPARAPAGDAATATAPGG